MCDTILVYLQFLITQKHCWGPESLKWKDTGKSEFKNSAGSLSGKVREGHFLDTRLSTAIVVVSVLFQPGPLVWESGLMWVAVGPPWESNE